LGRMLSAELQCRFLDADDLYWEKTDPPYTKKVPKKERIARLHQIYDTFDAIIITGGLMSWGAGWEAKFDLSIFVSLPHQLRMERLQQREQERYGASLVSNADIRKNSEAFLAWAGEYDNPNFDGKNITRHQRWIAQIQHPLIRIENTGTKADLKRDAMQQIQPYL
ncbi:MAG: hypothetical protein AAFQ68_28165, partial [Bacteroidota bacterium]